MNIFYIDESPLESARMQCDKHVVKMILESAQMLCTAHRVCEGTEVKVTSQNGRRIKSWEVSGEDNDVLYKATHPYHPSTVWARTYADNYQWLYSHFASLCKEYTYRYGRTHLSETRLMTALAHCPLNVPAGRSRIALAMPSKFKEINVVKAYRKYYISKTETIDMRWTRRPRPEWI